MFILNILPYLILTIVSEELCLFIMKEKKVHIYIVCLVMNIFTNLSLNIILQFCNNYYLFLFFLEVIVYLFEFFAVPSSSLHIFANSSFIKLA